MIDRYFEILPSDKSALNDYKSTLTLDIRKEFGELSSKQTSAQDFKFYTSVSVISSSKIEGETLEVDSYLKHKMQDIEYLPNLTQKPDDLFEAYIFAQTNHLNYDTFIQSHKLISQHLLPEKDRGNCRTNEMLVMEHNSGRIQYEAASAKSVNSEFKKLWNDINILIREELSTDEIFFHAAAVHLVFVNIHPFNDGNGRAARLLEKWFLAEKLGEQAWYISSEEYYYKNVNTYYRNLSKLGMFYETLDYSKATDFLQMLPQSLVFKA